MFPIFNPFKTYLYRISFVFYSFYFILKQSNPYRKINFFGYKTRLVSFLESFNLMYYYSMPSSIAIVLKKRLNLLFLFFFVVSFTFFLL